MEMDLTKLDEDQSTTVVMQLLRQLRDAQAEIERAERRAAGLRKMIDGLVEMFPAAEDLLPDDLDDGEEPRPRGAEAARRVLAERSGEWHPVGHILTMLERHNWAPNSSNPANAVRTALERLVESDLIEKGRSTDGAVVYRHHPRAEAPTAAAERLPA